MKIAYACNKTLCFKERPGFVSRNNIYQRPLSDMKQVGLLTIFFKLKTSNRSDKWFEMSLLGSNKSILRSPVSTMLP